LISSQWYAVVSFLKAFEEGPVWFVNSSDVFFTCKSSKPVDEGDLEPRSMWRKEL